MTRVTIRRMLITVLIIIFIVLTLSNYFLLRLTGLISCFYFSEQHRQTCKVLTNSINNNQFTKTSSHLSDLAVQINDLSKTLGSNIDFTSSNGSIIDRLIKIEQEINALNQKTKFIINP